MTATLEAIYREHRQGLFTLALTITGSHSLAEDAVHDAFVRLCDVKHHETGNLRAYVYAAVRNAAIDATRRLSTQSRTAESVFNGFVPTVTEQDEPGDDVLTRERDRFLREAVDSLAESDREVVLLRAFAGLTFDEIAKVIGSPMKTVASRYRRALARLEEQLKGKV